MLHAHWGLARLAWESLGTQDDGDKTQAPGSPHSGRGHGEAPLVTSASIAEARAKPWLHLTGGGEEQSDLTSKRQGVGNTWSTSHRLPHLREVGSDGWKPIGAGRVLSLHLDHFLSVFTPHLSPSQVTPRRFYTEVA